MQVIIYGKNNLESFDKFMFDFSEWISSSLRSSTVEIKINKLFYDYLFKTLNKINEHKKLSERNDWTLELEPSYGEPFKYITPFGNIIITTT